MPYVELATAGVNFHHNENVGQTESRPTNLHTPV